MHLHISKGFPYLERNCTPNDKLQHIRKSNSTKNKEVEYILLTISNTVKSLLSGLFYIDIPFE